MKSVKPVRDAFVKTQDNPNQTSIFLVTELTEEEKLAFISNTNFQNALKRIGSVVENVVANNRDITKDYARPNTSIDDADDVSCSGVLLNVMFECELTTNRCITDMDWSPFVADRIVASYHSNVV